VIKKEGGEKILYEEEFCICFLEAEYKALLPFYGGPGSGVFFVDKNI